MTKDVHAPKAPNVPSHWIPRIPVLNYHHVHDGEDSFLRTRPKLFRTQMEILLEQGYRPIVPDELIALRGQQVDERLVLVSFDDAYVDFRDCALPILDDLSIPATVFVPVDHIGKSNDWDDIAWGPHQHLSLVELRQLRDAGVVLASHSKRHIPLMKVDDEELRTELAGSRRELESLLGIKVPTFAYPGGNVDQRIRDMTAEFYDLGFATDVDADGSHCDPFLIPRFDPCFFGDLEKFRLELQRRCGLPPRRRFTSLRYPTRKSQPRRDIGNVLGIACTGHGAALALVSAQHGVRAMTLDRFSRLENSMLFSRAEHDDIMRDGDPLQELLAQCYGGLPPMFVFEETIGDFVAALLSDLPIGIEDIDLVVAAEHQFVTNVWRLGNDLNRFFPDSRVFVGLEHHEVHRLQAFLGSQFDSAAVLTIDACGENLERLEDRKLAMSLAVGDAQSIELLAEHLYPESSPGFVYAKFTEYLGFFVGQEGKTMGLASWGRDPIYTALRPLLTLNEDGSFHFLERDELWDALGQFSPQRAHGDPIEEVHQDIAYAAQGLIEDIVSNAVQALARRTDSPNLCIAGGVGLNSVANEKAFAASRFERLYVMPNSGDTGHALGLALYGARVVHHEHWNDDVARLLPRSDYLGPGYSDARQRAALAEAGLDARTFHQLDELVEHVAGRIADGAIVGWFQGGSEFGPRALGNRSLLADPRRADMVDELNLRVKHRETFRPFAPAVLVNKASEWFELEDESPFMLRVVRVRDDKRDKIPAVTHVDGTARVQTVARDVNPRFHALIEAFERHTSVPVVLNTSFNVAGSPIVETPEDAIDCFCSTNIDVLVLGDQVVHRPKANNR